ncbi:MAG: ribosome maturation factor RimP [Candidatus Sericytochromatia bacterium]
MNLEEIVKEVREKTEPLIKEKNYEIYDIQYKKENKDWILRFFIDNQTRSINLDECAEISREISELLDANFPDMPSYMLEVSSPGLDRLLKNDSDFMWAMGKTLKVKFLNSENKKEVIEGKILSLNEENIELEISKKKNTLIAKSSIQEARRVMKFDEIMPKK